VSGEIEERYPDVFGVMKTLQGKRSLLELFHQLLIGHFVIGQFLICHGSSCQAQDAMLKNGAP
jgi:hypothetical protein